MALNMPDAPWAYFCLAMWMDPAEDDQNRAWARGFAQAMKPYEVGTPTELHRGRRGRGAARSTAPRSTSGWWR